jgi:tRNA(adenine34) deaminase
MSHEFYMQQAYQQALMAFEEGEIPVGAVVVAPKGIIAKAYNQTEKLQDVTAHAEMLALTAAANYLGAKYLTQCTLYVTLEPCLMCAGAVFWSQIKRIVIGAADERRGFLKLNQPILHPRTELVTGLMEKECGEILTKFFKNIRT